MIPALISLAWDVLVLFVVLYGAVYLAERFVYRPRRKKRGMR